jgi:hypothetical protein
MLIKYDNAADENSFSEPASFKKAFKPFMRITMQSSFYSSELILRVFTL